MLDSAILFLGLGIGLYMALSHIRDTGEQHSTVQNKMKNKNNKSALFLALFLRKSSLCHVYANSLNF